MAEDLNPTKQIEPEIRPGGVPSLVGSGAEALSKIALNAGVGLESIVNQKQLMAQHQSQLKSTAAQYLATGAIGNTTTDASIDFLNDPANAEKASQYYLDHLDEIAKLTPTDTPARLQATIDTAKNAIRFRAATAQHKSFIRKSASAFLTEWDGAQVALTTAATAGDFDKYKEVRDNITTQLNNLDIEGVLSDSQVQGVHKILDKYSAGLIKAGALLHGDEESHINAANKLLETGVPIKLSRSESARDAADKLHNTSLFNQLTATVASGGKLDIGAFINLKPEKQDLLLDYVKGAEIVDGRMSFGTDFQKLNERNDYLLSLKNPSPIEQGEQQRLGNILNSLNAGEFHKVIDQIPAGRELYHDWVVNSKAPPNATPQQQEMIVNRARDDYLTQAATLWRSQNGDPSFIRVGTQSTAKIESAIMNPEVGADVAVAEIATYSPHNRVYVANSLKDPIHQTASLMVGNLIGKVPQHQLNDLVNSIKNYKTNKQTYANINKNERKDFVKKVQGFLGDNKDELDYLQTIGATDVRNSIAKLQVQYILHKTLENHGDITGGDEFNTLVKKSLNITTGQGYSFSLNAMPGVSPSQAASVGNKVLREAYAKVGSNFIEPKSIVSQVEQNKGSIVGAATSNLAAWLSNYYTRSNISINVFNEFNGDIKAVDLAGNVIVSHQLTDDFIKSALTE